MWHIHRIEYYLAIKRNEILIHATRRINLENSVLSEKSQSRKTIYCVIPYCVKPYAVKCLEEASLRSESRLGLPRAGWDEGLGCRGSVTAKVFSGWGGDKNALRLIVLMVALCEYPSKPWNYTFSMCDLYGIHIPSQ